MLANKLRYYPETVVPPIALRTTLVFEPYCAVISVCVLESPPDLIDTFPFVKERGLVMPRTRNPYPAEFREQIIALARAGRRVKSLVREFEPCATMIHHWVKQAGVDAGDHSGGLTSAERDELRRLRRENRQLRQERDIFSKAAAWFARDEISSPRSSSS